MIDVTQRVKDMSDYKYIYFYTQSGHVVQLVTTTQ